ncbi:MAG: hypothetical protein ACXVP7_05160, partial [Actinomycetota bacterium]
MSELTVNVVTAVPPTFTAVAPVKPVPVTVTVDPTGPLVGVNEVIVGVGEGATVKFGPLVSVPSESVTLIFPVVAPVGTIAVICVSESTVKDVAAVPLKLTVVT